MSSPEGFNAYTCTTREATNFIYDCLDAKLVPMMVSDPGMGKSSIYRAIAKKYKLFPIDMRLSTIDAVNLTGYPDLNGKRATYKAFDNFPLEGDPIPEGYNGWLLILDEFNSAPRDVIAAAYKLILDRMIGDQHLHEMCWVVAAGNKASSRAIVNPIGTAMASRLVHMEINNDFQVWLEDVALPLNFDSRIIAYLSQYPSRLSTFNTESKESTFCCARTWEFLSRLIKDKEIDISKVALYSGTIGSGIALDFVKFCDVYTELLKIEDIVKDPEGIKMPTETPVLWATATMLLDHVSNDNFAAICKFVERMKMEFRILFFKGVSIRKKELLKHPAFMANMKNLAQYLFGK